MLDFGRKTSSSQNGQGRQERRRLLALVLLLGVAFLVISMARDPSVWRFFDQLFTPQQDDQDKTSIDNRLDAIAPNGTVAGVAGASNGKSTTKPEDSTGYFPGVNRESLASVQDDAPSNRDEQACSLELLDILNRTDSATLDKASVGPITYAQLFRQPNQYRGRLVSVAGTIRRANRIDLSPNEYNLKVYYQVWLWPTDNPSSPVVIYCLDLPKGFPIGMEIAEQAHVTGFFFKRWAYPAKDAPRTAPTLLSKNLNWKKRPPTKAEEPPGVWAILLPITVALLVAMFSALVVYLRTRPTPPVLPAQPPDFDALRHQLDGREDSK